MSMLSINSFGIKTEFKHLGEVCHETIFNRAQRRLVAKQYFHGGHRLTFAGDNQIEITEIRVDVEGKAVRRDPACDVNSDRRNLAALSMNTCQTLDAKRVDPEVSQRSNQHLFEVADVPVNIFTIRTEINDGINDHLAQAVIRHFSAAIRFEQRHVLPLQLFLVQQNRRTVAATTDGE